MRQHAFYSIAIFAGLMAQGNAAPPVRLTVDAATKSIPLGQTAKVTIGLRDAYNNIARAQKDYRVMLQLSLGNAPLSQQRVLIRAGQDSAVAEVTPSKSGIILVRASHPELREDAIYIQVRASSRQKAAGYVRLASFVEQAPIRMQEAPSSSLELQVVNTVAGAKLSANGKDALRIQAFLSGGVAPVDLTVRLSCSAGQLAPEPFVIAKNLDYGEIFLTSQKPGTVQVKFVDVKPPNIVKVTERGDANVVFEQAVTLHLVASPPTIPLGSSAELQIAFWDLQNTETPLDQPRDVHLTIMSGLGDFNKNPVRIEKGQSSGSATFTPRKPAHTRISAAAFGASAEPVQLNVSTPVGTLAAAGIGGIIGGLLAAIRRKQTDRRSLTFRCGAGAVVAIVFALMCQQGLLPLIPAATASNPLWVQVIAIPSGWGGVELLDAILRKFGLLPGKSGKQTPSA
jgi:hypothetical protein